MFPSNKIGSIRILLFIIIVGLINYWTVTSFIKNKFATRISRIAIDGYGNLHLFDTELLIVKKVKEQNGLMEKYRKNLMNYYNISKPVERLSPLNRVHLFEDNPQYHEFIKNFSCVVDLSIMIDHTDDNSFFNDMFHLVSSDSLHNNTISIANNPWLLHTKYYLFTASELLCQWIINDTINYRNGYFYNYTCNTDIKMASIPTPINPLFFNIGTPTGHDKGPAQPPHRFQLPKMYYTMQIFTKVVVTSVGECFCNQLQVKFYDCLNSPSQPPTADQIANLTFHKEVFVISQRWGYAYFHRMIENIPRLALFLQFLTSHPEIKILAFDRAERLLEILDILGINRDRVITGWIRADIAYVPRATSCGTPNLIEMQFLQKLYTKYIVENLTDKTEDKRNKLILIKRSGSRRFTDYVLIEKLLNETAAQYEFEFVIFKDNPSPSLNDTMLLFHLASIVVAPHGAGLSNLIFGRPGTLVIEGLCNRPIVNLCYHRTSYALGMRWHGIPALKGCEGVIDVKGEDINFVLRSYLQIIPYEELTC